jgi:hypothetical protein
MKQIRIYLLLFALLLPFVAEAGRRVYEFGDFSLRIGDGRQTLEILRGPCQGEVQENRQFFATADIICFTICDGTQLCFEIGRGERSAEFLPGTPPELVEGDFDVVSWDGRFVNASVDVVGAEKTENGPGFVSDSHSFRIDLEILFGTGVVQIPEGLEDVPVFSDYPEGIVEYYDESDFPRPQFYLINVEDITEKEILSGLLPQALSINATAVEPYPYQAIRLSPPQVVCPVYSYKFLYDIEIPSDGTYMVVVLMEKEDGFSVDPEPLVIDLQNTYPAANFFPINADSSIGTGEAAKSSFSLPFLVKVPEPNEVIDASDAFAWLTWEDSDQDMLPDLWEEEVFAGLPFDAQSDEDSDGFDNFTEFFRGSDPNRIDQVRIYVKNFERDGEVEGLEFNKFWLGDNWFPRYQSLSWRIDPIQRYYGYEVYVQKVTQDGLIIYDNSDEGQIPLEWKIGDKLQIDLYTDQAYCFVIHWAVADDDGDFLNGIFEIENGLDPTAPEVSFNDSDGDGASDGWEDQYGFNSADPLDVLGSNDTDGDGLSDLIEATLNSNPNSEFTDSDVFSDGYEVQTRSLRIRYYDGPYSDFDNDDVPNHAEYWLGFDVNLSDSDFNGISDSEEDFDGDGMPDSWEAEHHVLDDSSGKDVITYFLDATTDDSADDADSDGLSNIEEYNFGTSAADPDSDNDCISDYYESLYSGLDPLDGLDWSDDEDSDGILNIHEFLLGFHPQQIRTPDNAVDDVDMDRDGDLMPDSWEASFALRARDEATEQYTCSKTLDWELDDASADYDLDSLSNYQEYQEGTNPVVADTDGDGMLDGFEVNFGLNPKDVVDGLTDLDGDGASNRLEHDAGTDPTDINNVPTKIVRTISIVSPASGFATLVGRRVLIEVAVSDVYPYADAEVFEVNFYISPSTEEFDKDGSPDENGNFSSDKWLPESGGSYDIVVEAVDIYGDVATDQFTINIMSDEDGDELPDPWEQALVDQDLTDAIATIDDVKPYDDFDRDRFPNVFEFHHQTDATDPGDYPVYSEIQSQQSPFIEVGDVRFYRVTKDVSIATGYSYPSLIDLLNANVGEPQYGDLLNDYDIIEITPGVYSYNGTIRIDKKLFILSTEGARNTILDTGIGYRSYPVSVYDSVAIDGIRIRGSLEQDNYSSNGGGFYFSGGTDSDYSLVGCMVDQNLARYGGGIYLRRGHLSLVSCTIADNYADQGAGIYVNGGIVDSVNSIIVNSEGLTNIDVSITNQFTSTKSIYSYSNSDSYFFDDQPLDTEVQLLGFDLSLPSGSVAKDAANQSLSYSGPDCDYEWVVDGQRDIGADEFVDTDLNGLPDWLESFAQDNSYDITDSDWDNDLLSNLQEYVINTDPFDPDTDDDGIQDFEETVAGADGFVTNPRKTDSDGDSLGDAWEILYGFDPTQEEVETSTDTDNDGVTLLEEAEAGSSPFLEDTDADGFVDLYEIQNGSDPSDDTDTDGNGIPDGIETSYGMDPPSDLDSDNDGIPDDYEVAFGLNPNDPSDANDDADNDELSNLDEYLAKTKANYFDSDGDLLSDGWEVEYGMNPLVADNINTDADGDGIDAFDEYRFGTNPFLPDTDGDSVSDGIEINQGSNANNSSDNGQAPNEEDIQEVSFSVGDPSGSRSERWEMVIQGLDPDTRQFKFSNRSFGTVGTDTFKLRKDSNYSVTLRHIGSNLDSPDYDWNATIDSNSDQIFNLFDNWVVDNTSSLLSNETTGSVSNKEVLLLKVDFDIVHPASGELSDAKEDVNDGGYVSIKRGIDGDDVAPVTQLLLHKNNSLPSTAKFRLKFNDGDRYKIYSDDTRQTLVEPEVTEFNADTDTTLYFQGLAKSQSRGGEEVTMQIGVGGNWYDGDSVKCTIVQSEFEIVNRVFIPYNWVDIPWHPFHTDDVAEGDDRDFDSTLEGTYRVEQRVVVNPYEDLSSNRIRSQSTTPGATNHFDEDDVVNFDEDALHSGLAAVQPSYIPEGATLDNSGFADITQVAITLLNDLTNDTQTFVELKGSASEPIVFLAQPIDWQFNVGVEIDDPLNPTVAFSGMHDGFPAYEVYINANHPIFPVTEVLEWAPPIDKGVLELFGGADVSAGSGIRMEIEQ